MNNFESQFYGPSVLSVRGLSKTYKTGESFLTVLNNINLDIKEGEAVCFLGPSGSGKSTLLQILGTLDKPTLGKIFYKGEDISALNDDDMSKFRNETMGFVFQFHHLIHELTALENVLLPCKLAGEDEVSSLEEAERWLIFLGLADRMHHYPDQLSGGELQRVSIARSLVRSPKLLFADEPTGNLDSENSKRIQKLFFELQKQLGLTLIVVTHDRSFAEQFSRVFYVKDGQVSPLKSVSQTI